MYKLNVKPNSSEESGVKIFEKKYTYQKLHLCKNIHVVRDKRANRMQRVKASHRSRLASRSGSVELVFQSGERRVQSARSGPLVGVRHADVRFVVLAVRLVATPRREPAHQLLVVVEVLQRPELLAAHVALELLGVHLFMTVERAGVVEHLGTHIAVLHDLFARADDAVVVESVQRHVPFVIAQIAFELFLRHSAGVDLHVLPEIRFVLNVFGAHGALVHVFAGVVRV